MKDAIDNLIRLWGGLDTRRRLVAGLGAVAVLLAVMGLARMGGPGQALLYSGLEGRAAGAVIAELEGRGVQFTVQGPSIYVPAARRDELRLALAAAGLPEAGPAGYELLDSIGGFSTTAQMFDAAYWRAREGELARTVLALPGVRSARVHISNAPATPFQRGGDVSASVTVGTQGAGLSRGQARAIRHLVAAAVGGLVPERVAVIDSAHGLVPLEDEGALPGEMSDLARDLRARVERLLAAHLGPGRAVVEVSVETDRTAERLTERRIDPESRVVMRTDTEERTGTSQGSGPGAVTVASDLPDGDAAAGGDSRSSTAETRERVEFDISSSSRELTRGPGDIRRLSVAVLVAGGQDGADLDALRALVEAAVGADAARGDVVTLRALPFPAPSPPEEGARGGFLSLAPVDIGGVLRLAILAAVVVILSLFLLRPLLLARGAAGRTLPEAGGASGPVAESVGLPGLPELPARAALPPEEGFGPPPMSEPGWAMGDWSEPAPPDPVEELRRIVESRREEAVAILRAWAGESQTAPAPGIDGIEMETAAIGPEPDGPAPANGIPALPRSDGPLA